MHCCAVHTCRFATVRIVSEVHTGFFIFFPLCVFPLPCELVAHPMTHHDGQWQPPLLFLLQILFSSEGAQRELGLLSAVGCAIHRHSELTRTALVHWRWQLRML